jgi:hypothetical protein
MVWGVTRNCEGTGNYFTEEFKAIALILTREMAAKRASKIIGKSNSRMWRIPFAHLKTVYDRMCFKSVLWRGADEKKQRKAYSYRPVFADLVTRWAFFAKPSKEAPVW